MVVDLTSRRQEREAEKLQRDMDRCARVLAEVAGRYAMADEEQQSQLALVMEEALNLLLDLRSGRHAA